MFPKSSLPSVPRKQGEAAVGRFTKAPPVRCRESYIPVRMKTRLGSIRITWSTLGNLYPMQKGLPYSRRERRMHPAGQETIITRKTRYSRVYDSRQRPCTCEFHSAGAVDTWAWRLRHQPAILKVGESQVERHEPSFVRIMSRLAKRGSHTPHRWLHGGGSASV